MKPVERPHRKDEYLPFFKDLAAAKGWEQCRAQLQNAATEAWDQLVKHPKEHSDRQYRLRGDFASGQLDGEWYEQWQYKVSDAARIRYLVDDRPVLNSSRKPVAAGRIVIVEASPGHPKDTEKPHGRR